MAVYTTIDDAGSFFNPVLYTGTGSSLAVTGAGFQPDFVWLKNRSEAYEHSLYDALRGATKYLGTEDAHVEITDVQSLTAFDSDGFTVGTTNAMNKSTNLFVSWNWKAGTTTGIAGSPSITPASYSFNATSGFSIIKYVGNGTSGATLPHGLGVAPDVVIVKNLDATDGWPVYHASTGATKYFRVDNIYEAAVSATRWNDTAPTSTLFSLGDGSDVNTNTENYIAYCFTSIQGYSKFSGYTGNDNANGTFVYTGFRPSYVLIKASNYDAAWTIYDTKRLGYNTRNDQLIADTTAAEVDTTNLRLDLLSTGFKCKGDNSNINGAYEYIYLAFAEAPFVNSSGVPVNAR